MQEPTRTVAIVAPHFRTKQPCGRSSRTAAGAHLSRFGWKPIIVTTHHDYYEEALDWDLASLVDPALDVVRTKALATLPIRLIGDIGVRAFPWHLSALRRLKRERRVDFVHITVPSFYSALLGARLFARDPQPFGIDYIDPWVPHVAGRANTLFQGVGIDEARERLEPYAVQHAALITGVAEGYYAGVLKRSPQARRAVCHGCNALWLLERAISSCARVAARAKPTQFDPPTASSSV